MIKTTQLVGGGRSSEGRQEGIGAKVRNGSLELKISLEWFFHTWDEIKNSYNWNLIKKKWKRNKISVQVRQVRKFLVLRKEKKKSSRRMLRLNRKRKNANKRTWDETLKTHQHCDDRKKIYGRSANLRTCCYLWNFFRWSTSQVETRRKPEARPLISTFEPKRPKFFCKKKKKTERSLRSVFEKNPERHRQRKKSAISQRTLGEPKNSSPFDRIAIKQVNFNRGT